MLLLCDVIVHVRLSSSLNPPPSPQSQSTCSQSTCSQSTCSQLPCSQLPCSQSTCSQSTCSQLPCSQSTCSQLPCSQLPCSQSTCSQSTCYQLPCSQSPLLNQPPAINPSCFQLPSRIVLQPTFAEDGNCSSCSTSICDSGNISASIEALDRNISEVFRGLIKGDSSIHNFFDVEAVKVLCSDSSNWTACPQKDTKPLRGFETRTEKAYVVLFVFFGACSVVLGIVLLSICYEDRLMKAERRLSSSSISGSNHKDYNRERPLSGMSMQSNEED